MLTKLLQIAPLSTGHREGPSTALKESFPQPPYDLLAGTELNFDPQAFFDDYMFTGEIQ